MKGYGTRLATTTATETTMDGTSDRPLETFWLLTIMNGASTIGRMLLAHFSDILGALNMHIGSTITASLLVLLLWTLAGSETEAIVFCVVFGLVSGMVIGLPPASVGNILNCTYTSPEDKPLAKKKLGHWTGMMYFFAGIPALAGPLVAGHLITEYKSYITVQLWSGTCLVICFCCMFMARWYLPWANESTTKEEITHFINKIRGRESSRKNRKESESTVVGRPEPLSQAPTRVASAMPSPKASLDKTRTPGQMV